MRNILSTVLRFAALVALIGVAFAAFCGGLVLVQGPAYHYVVADPMTYNGVINAIPADCVTTVRVTMHDATGEKVVLHHQAPSLICLIRPAEWGDISATSVADDIAYVWGGRRDSGGRVYNAGFGRKMHGINLNDPESGQPIYDRATWWKLVGSNLGYYEHRAGRIDEIRIILLDDADRSRIPGEVKSAWFATL